MILFSLMICGLSHAEPTETALKLAPGWTAKQSWESPFATQAAAADDKQFYAISNTTVAKYDRKTGKLIHQSEGDAEHLNSGFFFEGKLYCAHSNYPKKPDESEIKVYDPKTGKLSRFHQFKNPPGSLVWNIHDGKHWWCCFAHYQEDNAKTFLAKMDKDWNIIAQWKFPKDVIADWDKMSASGGIWDGDTLLTTHHHFKLLYRVRLPKNGDTLELVEAIRFPLPGQGIARDPATQGLIGIDRTHRTVVLLKKEK